MAKQELFEAIPFELIEACEIEHNGERLMQVKGIDNKTGKIREICSSSRKPDPSRARRGLCRRTSPTRGSRIEQHAQPENSAEDR